MQQAALRRPATSLEVGHRLDMITSDKPEHEMRRAQQLDALAALICDLAAVDSEHPHG